MKKTEPAYRIVMLIDDNEIDNFINTKMIEGCNFAGQIYTNTDGKSALEFLKNIEKMGAKGIELLPQIIFLDLNMPGVDGFKFIENFEKALHPDFRKGIQIVILTSSMNPSDSDKARNTPSVNQYISKPLNESALQQLHTT
jgi:CheY-like chemotaxis protein